MGQFLNKLGTIVKKAITPASIQFRLTLEITTILVIGFGIFTLWTSQELKRVCLAISDNGRLEEVSGHMTSMSLLLILAMTILASLSIARSLSPLRQMTNIYRSELKPYPIQSAGMPREIKTLARNWNRLLEIFTEAGEQQRQLANDLAHELRTPLSMIYGFLQRTQQRSENLTPSQKESLDMAVEDARRMIQLLQNWLDLTRSDEGAIPMPLEVVSLNELLREVVEMTRKLERRPIALESPSFEIPVKVDRKRIMQILSHLLENAIQYSDAGEPVTAKLTQVEDRAVIEIIDRGCGISPSEQSRIFDPFYRVDPSRTRSTGGAGLGLSLVKRSVEKMGGEISVRSQLGKGSTFILELPIVGEER
ncbi:MAG: Signal transduction histidine-protein kinase ArlS [Chroococcopsis gigantea SAG 12.99]|jgi:signal transduction histidine kinase|nr:Signal transduction histidine-protein kinase ArlS [Chroococcopsis gigantea SAG 12.99]